MADLPFTLPQPGESGMTCGTPVGSSRVCTPGFNSYLRVFIEDKSLTPVATGADVYHVKSVASAPAPSGSHRCSMIYGEFRCSMVGGAWRGCPALLPLL